VLFRSLADDVCFVDEFGELGDDDGEFEKISALVFHSTDDLLFVADTDNDRIQVFELTAESSNILPSVPKNLKASPVSSTSIMISWNEPEQLENVPAVSGYKIEHKVSGGDYVVITENTASTARSFIHEGLDPDERYSYRVYSVNSEGTSVPTSSVSAKPEGSTVPTAVTAKAISPSQIRVSWLPPSETYGQSVKGYEIKKVLDTGVYDELGSTNGQTRSFVVSNLKTDTTYTFAVSANMLSGSTNESDSASATPREDSVYTSDEEPTQIILTGTISTPPIKLTASVGSSTQVNLAWSPPGDDGNTPITGYKIEVKKDSDTYETLVADSKSTTRSYSHTDLDTKSKYTYRISAINSAGISEPSNDVSATPMLTGIKIGTLPKTSIDEGKLLSFIVKITDSAIKDPIFRLENNPPGTKIVANTGMFTWTPSNSDGGKSYRFDIVAIKDSMSDRQSITITVNDVLDETPEPKEEPKQPKVPTELGIAKFVDESKDPQSYVDRYNSEVSYKKWFDDNYSEYDSIYQAVGLDEPKVEEPKTEVPKVKEKKFGICGAGTKLIDGVCTIIEKPVVKPWWQFW
jgi:titin